MRTALLVATCLAGCVTGNSQPPSSPPDASPTPDAPIARTCATGHEEKLQFTLETACSNDGSVEFCISDANPDLFARVTAVSANISCAAGGGRAQCHTPGQLLCFYPTAFPTQCNAPHGGATMATWGEICQLAAVPEIAQIVATVFD
ncbi:MAG: hypothetical protein ABI175_25815 [Polyangiales bacterium]